MERIPLDPEGVKAWLADAAQKYEQLSRDLAEAKAERASRELIYKEAYAQSLLSSVGKSREMREADALLGASDKHNLLVESQNKVTRLESELKALSKAIDIALALLGTQRKADFAAHNGVGGW